jgi:hypothetical protein
MYGVELYLKVRMAMLRDRLNQRETARRFDVDCGTGAKLAGEQQVRHCEPIHALAIKWSPFLLHGSLSILPSIPALLSAHRPLG